MFVMSCRYESHHICDDRGGDVTQLLSGPTIMYEPEIKIFNSGGPSYVRTLKINNYLAVWLFGHGNVRGVGEGGIQCF